MIPRTHGRWVHATLLAALLTPNTGESQETGGITAVLRATVDSLAQASNAPGVSVGVVLADGSVLEANAGMADTTLRVPMAQGTLLLQGSVGKTYVAAVAIQLVAEGLLDLDARVARYLGDAPWYHRLPNSATVTVRQLMNHTSGIVRYEFDERFIADLLAEPDRVWRPEEQVAYLFDTEAPFQPGKGWDYSDTNYLILGLIIERLTGAPYYAELQRRVLNPLSLRATVPSNRRSIPGLAQGYAGPRNPFGPSEMLDGGVFAFNPQFEWTGGGIASTGGDLARWMWALFRGRAFDPDFLPVMLEGVPARLGPNAQYGLGVIIRPSPLGESWGHSGFFPGYLAEAAYFPDHDVAVAVQVNTSDFGALRLAPWAMLLAVAEVATAVESGR